MELNSLNRVIQFLDTLIDSLGRAVAWLCLLMALAMFASVVLSYFQINAIAFQESIVWMHGFVFLLGAAYTLQKDEHVRVDIFYQRFSEQQRAGVNLLGILFLLIPVMLFILWMSFSFVANSWRICEASSEAGGLPGRFLFRTLIVMMAGFMLVQGLASALRNIHTLFFGEVDNSNNNQRAIDLLAYGVLLALLLGFLVFTVTWFLQHCQTTSAGGLEQFPPWSYALLLIPYLCVVASVIFDFIHSFKSHQYRDQDGSPVHQQNHSGV